MVARLATVTDQILRSLETDAPGECLGELQAAAQTLDRHGLPTWEQLKFGARPQPFDAERGEWQHGWQHHASSASEHHFRETVIVGSKPTLANPTDFGQSDFGQSNFGQTDFGQS